MSTILPDFEAALAVIGPRSHRTPIMNSAMLSYECGKDVYLKAEFLRKTGSYKVPSSTLVPTGSSSVAVKALAKEEVAVSRFGLRIRNQFGDDVSDFFEFVGLRLGGFRDRSRSGFHFLTNPFPNA